MSTELENKSPGFNPDPVPASTGSSLLEQSVKKELRAVRRARRERQKKERDETESLNELAKYESVLAKTA